MLRLGWRLLRVAAWGLFITTLAGWAASPWYDVRLGLYLPRTQAESIAWSQVTVLTSQQTMRLAHSRGLPDPDASESWPRAGGAVVRRPAAPGWITLPPPSLSTPEYGWTPTEQWLVVPCWLAAGVLGVIPIVDILGWVRRLRRRREGCCPKCGYDLAGLANGAACPECGNSPPAGTKKGGAEAPPSSVTV
ncbi:MAG: hypothetical protein HBSAPP03_17880 [Phycisphaerae bacterium]|nr:MAG: hypothetical protein HBSAPP03_17880 [Phycisphaerae bacterium]